MSGYQYIVPNPYDEYHTIFDKFVRFIFESEPGDYRIFGRFPDLSGGGPLFVSLEAGKPITDEIKKVINSVLRTNRGFLFNLNGEFYLRKYPDAFTPLASGDFVPVDISEVSGIVESLNVSRSVCDGYGWNIRYNDRGEIAEEFAALLSGEKDCLCLQNVPGYNPGFTDSGTIVCQNGLEEFVLEDVERIIRRGGELIAIDLVKGAYVLGEYCKYIR